MNDEEFLRYYRDRIEEATTSGETDTKLGRVLTKWKDIDIPIQRYGKWLLEGFIMTFKRELEILNAIDPTISSDLPPHLLDPAQIAYFFSIPLEEFNCTQGASGRFLTAHDIKWRFHGKISLRLAYKIMDECEEVRAGRKRLVTAESFEKYLRRTVAETTPEIAIVPAKSGEPPTHPSGGKRQQADRYEFFPPPRSS
jgi:hypothetical protein